MSDATYLLPIEEKIAIIRRAGFAVMPRAEFLARFPDFPLEPGDYVIHSDDWNTDGVPDEGMVMAGNDAVILEASFAEAYSDDEWAEGITVENVEEFRKLMDKEWARRHLKVVK